MNRSEPFPIMRFLKQLSLCFCITFITGISFGQSHKYNKPLSELIDSLKNADQSPLAMKNGDSAAKAFQQIIRSNFPIVQSIARRYGFPGYSLVGEESSDNYLLLVQHSDFNVPFQKRILKLMKVLVNKGNASGSKYAYLVDRINLNEGKQQVYGTQIIMRQTGTIIKPCIDTLHLDERRKTVGLPPIKEYLKQADAMFYEMNKDRLQKSNNTDSIKKNGR